MFEDVDIYATSMDKEGLLNGLKSNENKKVCLAQDEVMDYIESIDYNEETGDVTLLFAKNNTKDGNIEDYTDLTDNDHYYSVFDLESQTFSEPVPLNKVSDKPLVSCIENNDISGNKIFVQTICQDEEIGEESKFDLFAYIHYSDEKDSKAILLDSDVGGNCEPVLTNINLPYCYNEADEVALSEEPVSHDNATYLFWYDSNNRLKYINISYLAEGDAFKNGEYDENEVPASYVDFLYDETSTARSDNKIFTDKNGNIYLAWTEDVVDIDTSYDMSVPPAKEIYVSALINSDKNEGDINSSSAWSNPRRITFEGKCNDGLNVITDKNGKMYIVHNQYELVNAGTPENPEFVVGDTNLMIHYFEPKGEVEATEFEFSDEKVVPGTELHVKATLENVGLMAENNFKTEFYEYQNGERGKKIAEFNYDGQLGATRSTDFEFDWVTPTEFDELSICCVTTENESGKETISFSDMINKEPDLVLNICELKQQDNKFVADCLIENQGGSVNKGYTLEAQFEGLYGEYFVKYGLDTDILAIMDVPEIQPGEVAEVEVEFEVPSSAFDQYGYDAVLFNILDGEDTLMTSAEEFITLDSYLDFDMNNGNDLYMNVGDKKDIGEIGDSEFISAFDEIILTSDNESVAKIEDTKVVATGEGNAQITAFSTATGMSDTMNVYVSKKKSGGGSSGGSNIDVNTYIVAFETNGGIPINPIEVTKGELLPELPIPQKDGYDFVGWYSDEELTEEFVNDKPVTKNTTLYAKWTEKEKREMFFEDVKESDWFYAAVKYAFDNELMNGTSDKTFEPLSNVTRGMFATVLWRLDGSIQADLIMPFNDVSDGEYYTEAIRWAAARGVVEGISEKLFEPARAITREEMATMLYRYIKVNGGGFVGGWAFPLDFKDADQVSDWAYEPMCYLTMPSVGLIQGMEDGSLAPKNNTNRAELATILMRFNQLDK